MKLNVLAIPHELRERPQWVRWKYQKRDGKSTKIPCQCNGDPASSTNALTWTTFGEACESETGDGIGYVFSADDAYVGIDLDNCVNEDGTFKPWGLQCIKRFDSYTEYSPSGRGVKIWIKAAWPGKHETGKRVPFKDGQIEAYASGRYFTVTGRVVEPYHRINAAQAALDSLYGKVLCAKSVRSENGQLGWNVKQCLSMLEKLPNAVSGDDGHGKTLRAACTCFRWGLTEAQARDMMDWWNRTKCDPPWTDKEIAHKLESALEKTTNEGQFGKYLRHVGTVPIDIPEPTEDVSGVERVVQDTISGVRQSIPWQWTALTSLTQALLPGTITTIVGNAGSSKSLLISQACLYWMSKGVPFCVFHLEEDREFHQMRALAQLESQSMLTDTEWVRTHAEDTLAALEMRKPELATLGRCIWDAPSTEIGLEDLAEWVRERCAEKRRIIVVDPVTAANPGERPWDADRKFLNTCKAVLRSSGASLVIVTHTRSPSQNATHLDNHAGGQAYNRFCQTQLSLSSIPPKEMLVCDTVSGCSRRAEVNRLLFIAKSRSGKGAGKTLGFWFDPVSLRFTERGVVVDE